MLGPASHVFAQQPCEGLVSAGIRSISIPSAVSVPAGSFNLPGRGASSFTVPAFCRVAVTIEKEVRLELWLPQQWNRKLVAVGNGGLAGSISYNAMTRPLPADVREFRPQRFVAGDKNLSKMFARQESPCFSRIYREVDRRTYLC